MILYQKRSFQLNSVNLFKNNFMEPEWIIIGGVVICAILLIYFLIKQNFKDEKNYETFLNEDYKKPNEKEAEINEDEEH